MCGCVLEGNFSRILTGTHRTQYIVYISLYEVHKRYIIRNVTIEKKTVYNFPKAHKKKSSLIFKRKPWVPKKSFQQKTKKKSWDVSTKFLPPPTGGGGQVPWLFFSSWRVPCDCTSVVHVNFHVALTGLGIGLLVWKSSGFFST